MLSSFITDKLSVSDYQELRMVMYVSDELLLHRDTMLTFFRLGMSELLSNLASGFPAAAEASRRLRTYIGDIDKFLCMQHNLESPNKINATDGIAELWAIDTEQTIPWDLLQNLPWDSMEWDIPELT